MPPRRERAVVGVTNHAKEAYPQSGGEQLQRVVKPLPGVLHHHPSTIAQGLRHPHAPINTLTRPQRTSSGPTPPAPPKQASPPAADEKKKVSLHDAMLEAELHGGSAGVVKEFRSPSMLGQMSQKSAEEEMRTKKMTNLLHLLRTRYQAMGGQTRIFRSLDKNKNNILSNDEIKLACDFLNIQVTDSDVELLMDMMGQQNNKIGFETFCRSVFSGSSMDSNDDPFVGRRRARPSIQALQSLPIIDKQALRRHIDRMNAPMESLSTGELSRNFRSLDGDNSGLVPVHKFKGALKRMFPAMTDNNVDGIIKSVDASNSGQVEYNEVIKCLTVEGREAQLSNFVDRMRFPVQRVPEQLSRAKYINSTYNPKKDSKLPQPLEGTPGYARDTERFFPLRRHRDRDSLEDSAGGRGGAEGRGSCHDDPPPPPRLSHRYSQKIDRMNYQVKQMDAFYDEDYDRKLQQAESRLKAIKDRKDKHMESIWYRRYGLGMEKERSIPPYTPTFPLNELIYG